MHRMHHRKFTHRSSIQGPFPETQTPKTIAINFATPTTDYNWNWNKIDLLTSNWLRFVCARRNKWERRKNMKWHAPRAIAIFKEINARKQKAILTDYIQILGWNGKKAIFGAVCVINRHTITQNEQIRTKSDGRRLCFDRNVSSPKYLHTSSVRTRAYIRRNNYNFVTLCHTMPTNKTSEKHFTSNIHFDIRSYIRITFNCWSE